MKAQAVVFTAPNQVVVQDVTCPDPGAGDVVVNVTHSWISNGTEGSFLRGERIAGDTAYRQGDPWPFPIVAGYQKIGVVTWVGSDIADIQVGETVFMTLGHVSGMFQSSGGHVSPSVGGRGTIWKLPDGTDPLAFAGLVLAQVGYNCGTRAPIAVGEGALVIGDGMVGHWAAQTLVWRGAQVTLVGRHEDRLARFPCGPGRTTVNERRGDWVAMARESLKADIRVAVDTVGSVPTLEKLLPLMAHQGHLVSAGFYGTADRLPLQPARAREVAIDMVSGWTQERMNQTRHLIATGHLDTLSLITHHFPVAQAAEAWALIHTKREPVLGVILDWS